MNRFGSRPLSKLLTKSCARHEFRDEEMIIRITGQLLRVHTEHSYVNGITINYFGDNKFIDKTNKLHQDLEKAIGKSFYGNHYSFEVMDVITNEVICIGINDGNLTIGNSCRSAQDSKTFEPESFTRVRFCYDS